MYFYLRPPVDQNRDFFGESRGPFVVSKAAFRTVCRYRVSLQRYSPLNLKVDEKRPT